MKSKLRIYPGHIFSILLILALVVMDRSVDDWGRLSNGFGNLISFFQESLWPPDWGVLEPRVYPECTASSALEFIDCIRPGRQDRLSPKLYRP